MRLSVVAVMTVALFHSQHLPAQTSKWSVSLFKTVDDLEGGYGVSLEHRVGPRFSLELSTERRRFVVHRVLYKYCPYQTTCIERHDIEVTSAPLALHARFSSRALHRVAIFGSIGARHVPKPGVRDLSAPTEYGLSVSARSGTEASVGFDWRVASRYSLFADGRVLISGDSDWDPKNRLNFGARIRF